MSNTRSKTTVSNLSASSLPYSYIHGCHTSNTSGCWSSLKVLNYNTAFSQHSDSAVNKKSCFSHFGLRTVQRRSRACLPEPKMRKKKKTVDTLVLERHSCTFNGVKARIVGRSNNFPQIRRRSRVPGTPTINIRIPLGLDSKNGEIKALESH